MSTANYKMMLMPHGGTAFFKDGEQVPEIQRNSWMILQFRELQRHGIDPRDVEITFSSGRIYPFVTEDGEWNYGLDDNPRFKEYRSRPMPALL